MKKLLAAGLLAASVLCAPAAFADDPDYSGPPPVLPGSVGGQLPGNQPLPAICAVTMIACAEHYDIDRGSWAPNGDS